MNVCIPVYASVCVCVCVYLCVCLLVSSVLVELFFPGEPWTHKQEASNKIKALWSVMS